MAIRIHGTFGSWVLPQGVSVLGRGTGCDVRIDDPRLSRNHARFTVSGHQLQVEEMGSRNGVLINGVRISGTTELRHGQVVVCGPAVLMVSIDQTQPHPRTPQGEQDPTTRRTSGRGDTEAMLAAVSVPPTPASGGRGIDPAILAAVSGSGEFPIDQSRQSALQPASLPGSMTSPLEAVRPSSQPASGPRPTRSSPSTSSLEATVLAPSSSGALEMPTPTHAAPRDRLLAGLIDGLAATGAAGCGLFIALAALTLALATAGATVSAGVPRLVPGAAADFTTVFAALFHPAGLAAGLALAPFAASASPLAAVTLVLGAALAAMAMVAGLLLTLVVPTVLRGAPAMHRRLGLTLVRTVGGTPPSYGRAMLRWLLAALLWPLAIPFALLLRRAPHDVLSGCTVRPTR